MKLSFVFCLIFSLSVSANVLSQNTVSLDARNITIRKAFKEIKKQTGLIIIYSENEVSTNKRISVSLKESNIDEALDAILKGIDLTYELIDEYIVIKPIKGNKHSADNTVVKEKIRIRGKVIDEEGNPIPFSSIQIKGTILGASTDFDGIFDFEIEKQENIILIASSVGYSSSEQAFTENKDILIVLKVKVSTLSEVVVTGYQTLSQERVTGSFGQVKIGILEKETALDLTSKLEGKIAGLLIDKNNDGSVKVQIRGQSTLFANQNPLIIVDGLPIEGGWESIESSDIQSVTVLKDASAASIWGTRAANGVIVIETKGGVKQLESPQINVNYSNSIGNIYDLADLQLASSSDLVDFEYFAHLNGVFSETEANRTHQGISPVFQLVMDKPVDISQQLDVFRNTDHTSQIEEYLMQKSYVTQFNLSIQTGSNKNSFYASLNTTIGRGVLVGNSYEKVNFSLKNNYSITDKIFFKIGLNSTIQNTTLNNISASDLANRKPYELILDEDGNYIPQTSIWNQDFIKPYQDYGYLNWDYNLKKEIDNRNNTIERFDNRFNTALIYRPITGLEINASFLYEKLNRESKNIANPNVYSTANMINQYTIYDVATGELTRQFPYGSIYTRISNPISSYTFRGLATYNTSLQDKKHQLNTLIGYEMREYIYETVRNVYVGYDDETLEYTELVQYRDLDLHTSVPNFYGATPAFPINSYRNDFSYSKERHLSYFANLGYTFLKKYSINASARVDQTNLSGVDKRFRNNPLWSVGLKWNVKNEAFLPDEINRLDIRMTYGFVGNIDRTAKSFATATYSTSIYSERFLTLNSPKNNDLSYEKTKIFNIGLDYAILKNRIYGSFEYFSKNSNDVLGFKQNDPTTGWTSIYSNYANLSNSGLEIDLNFVILKSKDLKLTLAANLTTVKNNVDFVESPQTAAKYYLDGGSFAARVGYPISSLYAFETAGINTEGDYLTYTANGDIVVGSDSYTLNVNDLVYMGQTDPTYFGGINTTCRYKKVNISLVFTYKGGHVSRMPIPEYGYAAATGNTHESITNAWTSPGDENKQNVLPGVLGSYVLTTQWETGAFKTDERVFDASLIRFKNLMISYDFNPGKKKSFFIQAYAEIRNVYVWTKNTLGIDPDYINPLNGTLRFTEPTNYILGIKAKL